MPKPKIDDPWTKFPTGYDTDAPPAPEPAALTLPQAPPVPGPDYAPIAEVSVKEAWTALMRARRDYVAALHHRVVVRARLSIAFRDAQPTRPTVTATQEHCETEPAYAEANALVYAADERYVRALGTLEVARLQAGIVNAEPLPKVPAA